MERLKPQTKIERYTHELQTLTDKIASARNIINTLGNPDQPFHAKGKIVLGLNTDRSLDPFERSHNLVRVVDIKTRLVDTAIPRFIYQAQAKSLELKKTEIEDLETSQVKLHYGVKRGFISPDELIWIESLITAKKLEINAQGGPKKVEVTPEKTKQPQLIVPKVISAPEIIVVPPLLALKLPEVIDSLQEKKAKSLLQEIFETKSYGELLRHLDDFLKAEPALDRRGYLYKSFKGAFFEEIGFHWLQKKLGSSANVQVISPYLTRELFKLMFPDLKSAASPSQFEYHFNQSVPDGIVVTKNVDSFKISGVAEYTVGKLASKRKRKQLMYYSSPKCIENLARICDPNNPEYSALAFDFLYRLLSHTYSKVPKKIKIDQASFTTHLVIPKNRSTLPSGRFHLAPFTTEEYSAVTSALFEDSYSKIQAGVK